MGTVGTVVVVEITIPALIALPLALLGAAWLYRDARGRRMETADMWAVGFVVGFLLLPLLGGLIVLAFYLRNRRGGGGAGYGVPRK